MIRTENGNTKLKGSVAELHADLTIVIKSFVDAMVKNEMDQEDAWKLVDESVETAKIDESELVKDVKEKLSEIEDLLKMMKEVFGKGGSKDE